VIGQPDASGLRQTTMSANGTRRIPRLALTRAEAAEALGVGMTTFKTRIAPELPVVRQGKVRLYRVHDLERWLERNAERPICEEVAQRERQARAPARIVTG
jgi:hypothetical protein